MITGACHSGEKESRQQTNRAAWAMRGGPGHGGMIAFEALYRYCTKGQMTTKRAVSLILFVSASVKCENCLHRRRIENLISGDATI